MVLNMEETDVITRLSKMRPSPNYYVAHGPASTVIDIYKYVFIILWHNDQNLTSYLLDIYH